MARVRELSIQKLALVHLGVALLVANGVLVALLEAGPLGEIGAVHIFPGLALLYGACGLLAWWRRPANRLGPLLLAAGCAFATAGLQNTGVPSVIALGKITSVLPLAVLLHLMLAVPRGRLRGRTAKTLVVAGYVDALLLQVPIWAFTSEGAPFDALLVSDRPDLAADGRRLQNAVGVVIVLVALWLLIGRLRAYPPRQRRLLAPLFVTGMLALLAVPVGRDQLVPRFGAVRALQLEAIPIAMVPLGFLALLLAGGFARMGELTGLVSTLSSLQAPGSLQGALSHALGDSTVQLLRWDAEAQTYLDPGGRPTALPERTSSRANLPLEVDGSLVAAVVYDPELTHDTSAVEPMLRVTAIALDRERLAQDAASSREALLSASSRLLVAGDQERRRIVSDLHDGLQGSLVRLSIAAHHLADELPDQAAAHARRLADDVDRAAADLRSLVQGVMPALLVERGLAAAVQELAQGLPVRVELQVDLSDRLPAPVESTAYFVVSEALTNVIKHAGARSAQVRLAALSGTLHIHVLDDGRGAAASTPGAGLTSLRDRLAVLGGDLRIDSSVAGTKLEAVLPCA